MARLAVVFSRVIEIFSEPFREGIINDPGALSFGSKTAGRGSRLAKREHAGRGMCVTVLEPLAVSRYRLFSRRPAVLRNSWRARVRKMRNIILLGHACF